MNNHSQRERNSTALRCGVTLAVMVMAWLPWACAGEHDATQTAKDYVDATRYGDLERAFGLHIASVQSEYCVPGFKAVLEAARKKRSTEECAPLLAGKLEDVTEVDDEVRLYLQVLHVICRRPEATCEDYTKEVFAEGFGGEDSPTGDPAHLRLHRVVGDHDSALAYVDVVRSGVTEHRTFRVIRVEGNWTVDDRHSSEAGVTE
jgi:hypothetical protein